MPTAFSYVRFSSLPQEKGNSIARQVELGEAYCRRQGLTLDKTMQIDRGSSAYRAKNFESGPLAEFINRLSSIPKGSYLIIEKLDRFSRGDVDVALAQFGKIVKAGITIVTTNPEREYTSADLKGFGIMELVVHFLVANGESDKKSINSKDNWRRKRANLRTTKLGDIAPAWLKLSEDRSEFVPIPSKVAIIKRIFSMARSGAGVHGITQTLNKEGIPNIGRTVAWKHSYIHQILTNRTVLGEYQPKVRNHGGQKQRTPIGDAIPDYYPRVISDADFYAVQKGLQTRRKQRGPKGKNVANLFTGLLRCARTGSTMVLINKGRGSQLVSSDALRGLNNAKYITTHYRVWEYAFLAYASELSVRDIRPSSKIVDDRESELERAQGQLDAITDRIGKISAKVKSGVMSESGLEILVDLDTEKKALSARVEQLAAEVHTSDDETLGETQSIIQALKEAEGEELAELRSTLRARIAALVDSVWVYISANGHKRLMIAQVMYKSGARKNLYIYWNPKHRHPGQQKGYVQQNLGVDLDCPDLRLYRVDKRAAATLEKHMAEMWAAV